MNNLFEKFLKNYLDGERFDNKEKEYHKILVEKLPKHIRSLVNDNYKIKGSCGASNKADVPWIGIFNKNITTTARYGIYVVYLFRADMKGFYLCLCQGVTNFEKYGKDMNVILYEVSKYFKNKINSDFSKDNINLHSRTYIGKNYEKANILNKYYDIKNINKYDFEKDLQEMISIYEEISNEMNSKNYDEIIENILLNINSNSIVKKEAIKMMEQEFMENFDKNEFNVVLQKVDIPEGKKKSKYKEMSKKPIKKIDYAKKQKKNSFNGLLGEKLVIKNEEQKLIDAGKEYLIDDIEWISLDDDGTGYDILSFDENGNRIYIEVKSTEGEANSDFFISANELAVMNELKNQYYIYRVYNLNTENPKFYVLNYNDFNNVIRLKEETYRASII